MVGQRYFCSSSCDDFYWILSCGGVFCSQSTTQKLNVVLRIPCKLFTDPRLRCIQEFFGLLMASSCTN